MLDGTESFGEWVLDLDEPVVFRTTDGNGICTLPLNQYVIVYTETQANGGEGWVFDIDGLIVVTRLQDGLDVTASANPTGKIWVNAENGDWAEAAIEMDAVVSNSFPPIAPPPA